MCTKGSPHNDSPSIVSRKSICVCLLIHSSKSYSIKRPDYHKSRFGELHHRRPQTHKTTTKHSQVHFLRHQQEGRQEGRQKETEGRQDRHNDQQEGRQDRRQREDKTGDKTDTVTQKKGDKTGNKEAEGTQ